MKIRGFVLIELIIVIVIIGILASIGFAQYQRLIERSRAGEARTVLGSLRTQAAGAWLEYHNPLTGAVPAGTFLPEKFRMGSDPGQIPTVCDAGGSSPNYYFEYNIAQNAANTGFVATATRCTNGGKTPTSSVNDMLSLTTDFATGVDGWDGSY